MAGLLRHRYEFADVHTFYRCTSSRNGCRLGIYRQRSLHAIGFFGTEVQISATPRIALWHKLSAARLHDRAFSVEQKCSVPGGVVASLHGVEGGREIDPAPGRLSSSRLGDLDKAVASRPLASVAGPPVTTVAKRTQQSCGVGY
jgi:hypothetical protein